MICWINGSFGAGKTVLAGELLGRCPGALLYDPEEVGFMLRAAVPPAPSGDFQDLRAWRLLVVEAGRVLAEQYGWLVIAPMTVVSPVCAREIFGGLAAYGVPVRHFFLKVPASVLRQRIEAQVISIPVTRPGTPGCGPGGCRRWNAAPRRLTPCRTTR